MNDSFVEKARNLQIKLDKKKANLPELTLENYLFFVSIIFILTGFGLIIYCLLSNINIINLQIMSNPLFYLIMSVFFIFWYIGVKIYNKKST